MRRRELNMKSSGGKEKHITKIMPRYGWLQVMGEWHGEKCWRKATMQDDRLGSTYLWLCTLRICTQETNQCASTKVKCTQKIKYCHVLFLHITAMQVTLQICQQHYHNSSCSDTKILKPLLLFSFLRLLSISLLACKCEAEYNC